MKPRHRPKDQAKARERLQEKETENKVPDFVRVLSEPRYRNFVREAQNLGPSKALDALIGVLEPWATDNEFRHHLQGPVVALLREAKAHYDKVAEEFLAIANQPPVPTEGTVVAEPTILVTTNGASASGIYRSNYKAAAD